MRVSIETLIEAPADTVWSHLHSSALLEHVAWPLQRFVPIDPPELPAIWTEGDYKVGLRAFGFIPLGYQRIGIRILKAEGWPRILRDDGGGQLVRKWDHRIDIEPAGRAATRYRDTVDIDAGLLTPAIWLYAQMFYRHRQRRWRALAKADFKPLGT